MILLFYINEMNDLKIMYDFFSLKMPFILEKKLHNF